VQEAVDAARNHVFLGEKLQRVGHHRVHQTGPGKTENAGPIGADAVLDERAALALNPPEDTGKVQDHADDDERFDRCDAEFDPHDARCSAAEDRVRTRRA